MRSRMSAARPSSDGRRSLIAVPVMRRIFAAHGPLACSRNRGGRCWGRAVRSAPITKNIMMTNLLRGASVFAAVILAVPGAAAAAGALVPVAAAGPVNPAFFSGMHWRLVGPFRGGRSVAATGVPGNPTLFYFGAVAGGVWKTNDAGRTWKPIFDGQPIASIGAIAVAPSDPNVIYVGSGEADMRSDITYGNGVYKSVDAGATWQHVGLTDTRQIGRIIVDPANPDIAFVAALGHGYGPNAERGVFRTTDGAKTWQKVLYKDENTGAIDLAFDPS